MTGFDSGSLPAGTSRAGTLRDATRAPLQPLERIVLLVLLVFPIIAHVGEIRVRGIDPDEFEHLHAAYLVSLGEVPYRDFFEHHGPAWYVLLAPLFKIFGATLNVLWAGRTMALAAGMASIWLTGRLATRLLGPRVGLVSVVLLVWSVVFHVKALEMRPDVPALFFLLLATSTLWSRNVSLRSAALAGIFAGVATLFTQKSIVPAAALWLAWVVAALDDAFQNGTSWTGRKLGSGTLAFALGGALPWLLAVIAFASHGAADDLWHGAVVQLWQWPLRMSLVAKLRPVVSADLPIWFAGTWEVFVSILTFLSGRVRYSTARVALTIAAGACLASLLFVKAAYPQFYLLWLPFLVILAARRLCVWSVGPTRVSFLVTVALLGLVATIVQSGLLQRAVLAGSEGALPSLWEPLAQRGVMIHWSLLMFYAATLFSATHGLRQRAVVLLVVLSFTYGLLRDVDAHVWPNERQVEYVDAVNARVPADGRVLDGFTGYAALRRHAFYYWWLNDYSKALIGKEHLTERLLPVLKKSPPAAILYDHHLQTLPDPVKTWLLDHYEPSQWDPLWLPRQ